MPLNPVSVSTSTILAPATGITYDMPAVVGDNSTGTASSNIAYPVTTKAVAETYFGTNSEMTKAINNIFNQGVRKVYAILTDGTSVSDYNTAYQKLQNIDVDIVYVPGEEATASSTTSATVLGNHINKCENNNWITVLWGTTGTLGNGGTLQSALSTIADSDHAQSDKVTLVVGKNLGSDFDLGAAVTGAISTEKQWNSLMYRTLADVDAGELDPSDVSIIEGEQCNALINQLGSWMLSNGYSLSATSSKKFLDVTRTARLLEEMFEDALTFSQIGGQIPYTGTGLKSVKNILAGECNTLVNEGALSGFLVNMPTIDEISSSDKADRILRNVTVTVQLAGAIHSFMINLTLQV